MLVLTRRLNESILIGENIEIKIVQIRGSGDQAVIRLGITAPREVTVLRREVYDEVVAANQQAASIEVVIPGELLEALQQSSVAKPRPSRRGRTEEPQ